MMATRLFLLLCLTGHVFAKEPPDVYCLIVHLQYVQCSWNKLGTPKVNYTFHGWFHFEKNNNECPSYMLENGIVYGCQQPYPTRDARFFSFYTTLEHGNDKREQKHKLESKVKFNPPTNLTVQIELDQNLWLYWNQTEADCVESNVRHRIDNKEWDTTEISAGKQNHCINLPCSSCRYEIQVQSRMEANCRQSDFWSGWSEPIFWGSNKSMNSKSVLTPLLIVFSIIILLSLVIMLLHYERLRIILIPVVPKPSLIPRDIEDWFQNSKSLKESFKPNYNELACTVQEYKHISQSECESSDSSDSSTCSITTDQTDCSVFIPVEEPDSPPSPPPQF